MLLRREIALAMLRPAQELMDPMLREKRRTIDALIELGPSLAARRPPYWAWTVWLSIGITTKRIENA